MAFDPIWKNNVTTFNKEGKETIVFAHGFGTDQTAWEQVAAAFKDKYRIILYDNVGAGKSAPEAFSPNKYDTLSSYAADLIDICNALHVENAIFVGHSVSGMIGVLAAIKQPSLFSKLVLVGASARYLNDGDYIGGFDQPSLDGLYQSMSNNYFAWVSGFAPAAMGNPNKPYFTETFARTLSAIRPDIAQSVARVIFQSDHRNILGKLEKPTLLLQTQQDIAVPMEAAEYLHKHIKNSTLHVVEAEGHFPHISAADKVINELRNFF
jgi:sigma-B regulation protein RsbQ